MEKTGYNGWTNYETWLWNIWHGDNAENDFGEIVRSCGRDAYKISKALEEWTDELYSENMPEIGFMADICNSALKEVNFYEIAEHLLEDIEPEADDESAE